MEYLDSIKKLPTMKQPAKRNLPPWRIALTANLRSEFWHSESDPPDAGSEFDSEKTILSITEALEADGHDVQFLSADTNLPKALADLEPDICFNIAEGQNGDGREAQVPALCEMLGIPYTASRVVSNAIALDKTLTKRIWRDAGLPTARFLAAHSLEDLKRIDLEYPLFIKPAREGSGMGIDSHSIIRDHQELIDRTRYILEKYHQPALIEEYLPGREFTVGFIGNPGPLPNLRCPGLYGQDGYHFLPILEIDSSSSVSPAVYGNEAKSFAVGTQGAPGYLCPANISPELHDQLIHLTKQGAEILAVCDVSRLDFRLDRDNQPCLMEINTLPGLSPGYSDLCIQASAEGLPYQTLITEILYLAAERFNLPTAISIQGLAARRTTRVTHPAARLISLK